MSEREHGAGQADLVAGMTETPPVGLRRAMRPTVAEALDVAAAEGALAVVGADGHGIYSVDALVHSNLPPALVLGLARWHRRLGSERGGLRGADGQPRKAVWGVHGLELLCAVARGLNLPVPLVDSWRVSAWQVASELAQWVHHQGGVVPHLGPPPLPSVAPDPVAEGEVTERIVGPTHAEGALDADGFFTELGKGAP